MFAEGDAELVTKRCIFSPSCCRTQVIRSKWVIERQVVTTHKDSGIVNDANLWATETMGDASYPLKLFQRVITVSIETMKIVRALPRLDIAVPTAAKS